VAFIVTFVNGGLTGLFLGNVVVDVPLSDTIFVVAHFHMVMGVAPILVIFGAIYHWYQITGRMLDETLGRFHSGSRSSAPISSSFPCTILA
jgi:cytochrome c oxidase subunit 1